MVKRNVALFVLLLSFIPAITWAGVVADTHFNELKEGGWSCYMQAPGTIPPQIVTDSSSQDPSSVLKINFQKGFPQGYFPMECDSQYFNSNEIYQQVYVKFPTGYEWQNAYNKISYDYLDTNKNTDSPGNLYIGIAGPGNGGPYVMMHLQPKENKPLGTYGRIMNPNVQFSPIPYDTWVKISWYLRLNDSGKTNGIAKVWVNDVLNLDYSDMNMRSPDFGTRNFFLTTLLPIFGGMGGPDKTKDDYFFMDRAIISTTPIDAFAEVIPQKEPKPPINLIIK